MVEARSRLTQAEELRQQRKYDRARKICEGLVRRYPEYVGALHTLGLVLADSGDFVGALTHLVRASMLNPRDWRTLTALSGVYLKLHAPVMAARTLEEALKAKPDDVSTLLTLADIYQEDDEFELAAKTFQRVLELEPSLQVVQVELGDCYMELGLFREAAEVFTKLFQNGTRSLRVCYNLSQLPRSLVSVDVLPHLNSLTPDSNQDPGQFESYLAYTKASALDRIGDHEAAWENVVVANRRKFNLQQKDYSDRLEYRQRVLAKLKQNNDKPIAGGTFEEGVPRSLFILGPSRSGKTTMERLVVSLDGVKRGYENKICDNVVTRVFQTNGLLTTDIMSAMAPGMHPMFREFYLEELRERIGEAEVFTITTPGVIIDALAIAKLVPNSRLIFVKRDFDDIAIRMFMKDYAVGNSYAYSIDGIREYIGWYQEIMDLCVGRQPNVSRIIQYEDMIENPKAALEVAAELCGLPLKHEPLPVVGDDRGCGKFYSEFMAAAGKE